MIKEIFDDILGKPDHLVTVPEPHVYKEFTLLGLPFKIDSTLITVMVMMWIIMLIIIGLAYWITRDLKVVPDKKQAICESFVNFTRNLVGQNMGEKYKGFIPFTGTLLVFMALLNLTGMIGIPPATSNISVALGFGIMSFVIIQGYSIYTNGIGHYLKAFVEPYTFMTPLNIVERCTFLISLSLRLFGNMLASAIFMDLVYNALHKASFFLGIGIPILPHLYFDVFDGLIQVYIFVMLTTINIKLVAEE